MKAVLISINPEWCDLIARGEKTLEVRRTRPKLETPFKCYIYRTKGKVKHILNGKWFNMSVDGDVIGEFVCDTFVVDKTFGHDPLFNGAACMSDVECAAYSCVSPIYGWHISDLKIYEKPKKLSDFRKPFPFHSFCKKCVCGGTAFHPETCYGCEHFENINITRPPQSWCYVEEVRLT